VIGVHVGVDEKANRFGRDHLDCGSWCRTSKGKASAPACKSQVFF